MLLAKTDLKDNTIILVKKILDLIENEALEFIDYLGNTALMYSAISNNVFFIKTVVCHLKFKHINLKNSNGKTVLMLAAESNSKEFIEELFRINLNLSTEDKEQALLLAAEKGHETIVELLLSKDINPNVNNEYGYTPLEVAIQNGHYNSAYLLIKNLPVRRTFLTAECFAICLKEISQRNEGKKIGNLSKGFSYIIEKTAVTINHLANSKISLLNNFYVIKVFQKIYRALPHWLEDIYVTSERKNNAMQVLHPQITQAASPPFTEELPSGFLPQARTSQSSNMMLPRASVVVDRVNHR